MDDVRADLRMAERRRELQVDERLDPFRARGDVTAADRGRQRLREAADRHHARQPVEGREARRGRALEIREDVVLDDQQAMFGRERQQPVRDGRRERCAGRVVQRGVGDVQARPVLGEHLLEAREIGAVRRVRDADDPRTVRAQQRLEVEVARIVEHDRVARLQQQPADEIERV